MINRNTALTPTVFGEVVENQPMNTSTVMSEENNVTSGQPPRTNRRQHQSNNERANYVPPAMAARSLNPAIASSVNRGYNKQPPGLQNTRNMNDGSGGQVNLHNVPNTTKGRAGYGALIQGGIQGYGGALRNQAGRSGNNTVDPFAKVNPKARKVIESVERNRHNTSERRTGSTGGSST